jgi:hypothetical protein
MSILGIEHEPVPVLLVGEEELWMHFFNFFEQLVLAQDVHATFQALIACHFQLICHELPKLSNEQRRKPVHCALYFIEENQQKIYLSLLQA